MTTHAGARLDLTAILTQPITEQHKAFPLTAESVLVGEAGEQGWNALQPPFSTPVMVLKDSALGHNIDLLAGYCAAHQVSFAPHVKTPLAPQIAERQLAAGTWALTVADIHQAAVLRRAGVQRLFLANEVVDPASAAWLARELTADPGLEVYCLVDSVAGATLLDGYLAASGLARRLPVLIELGLPGGRCGCRSTAEALHLARSLQRLSLLTLTGVEAYEGMFPHSASQETADDIRRFLRTQRELIMSMDAAHLLDGTAEILVSAGGSLWFDHVVAELGGGWLTSRPVRTVIRSGAYVTHDGAEHQQLSPLGDRAAGPPRLRQALELWATIISRPEPDLAILNFGKRDAAHDRGLPIPFAARTRNGSQDLDPAEFEILSLNDQHARLRVPARSALSVGDLVGSQISHPCTSFQCWRLIPLVDDAYHVLSAVRTFL